MVYLSLGWTSELWLYLYTIGVLFHVECCIRKLWCSSIIFLNINSIAYNHHTNIYPLLHKNCIITWSNDYITSSIQYRYRRIGSSYPLYRCVEADGGESGIDNDSDNDNIKNNPNLKKETCNMKGSERTGWELSARGAGMFRCLDV